LRTAFEKFGTVWRCEMTSDPATGWSKGFGFVSFSEPEAADAAMSSMHNSYIDGKQMRIEKTKADE
jgi:RNA recognition motif-containing protein